MRNQFEYINQYFDKIFVISIARAVERHEKIKLHLQGLNYELLIGIDKNDLEEKVLVEQHVYDKEKGRKHHLWNQPMILGQIACSLSHKKVYELQVQYGYKKVLILEDDVIVNQVGVDLFPQIIKESTCPPRAVQKYLNKISRLLLNRIDLHIEVTHMQFSELSKAENSENNSVIRERVIAAREIQSERYKTNEGIYASAQMSNKLLKEIFMISLAGQNLLKAPMDKLNLSARAYDRILKVSRTIADLVKSPDIKAEHLAEAIQYISLEREGWAG